MKTREFWFQDWRGKSVMHDPVLYASVIHRLRRVIRDCPEPMDAAEAGHFVQEPGEPIVDAAQQHFDLQAARRADEA